MPKRNDLARLWQEMEDELFPALNFDAIERALYYYLFSQTHLQGHRTVRLSLPQIARATKLSWYLVRCRTIQLRAKGCLRVRHRNRAGSVWELKLPRQALGPRRWRPPLRPSAAEALDCTAERRARLAVWRRERGFCFYCLRKISRDAAVLDHVVPRVDGGGSSYRNIVACCQRCNMHKSTTRAANFLRLLYRSGRLTAIEYHQRLHALSRLSRGQLRISLAA